MDEFLRPLDGEEVVVIDESRRLYYCGTEQLIKCYSKKGKSANSFAPLLKALYVENKEAA